MTWNPTSLRLLQSGAASSYPRPWIPAFAGMTSSYNPQPWIPAFAGMTSSYNPQPWIPAFAGMTSSYNPLPWIPAFAGMTSSYNPRPWIRVYRSRCAVLVFILCGQRQIIARTARQHRLLFPRNSIQRTLRRRSIAPSETHVRCAHIFSVTCPSSQLRRVLDRGRTAHLGMDTIDNWRREKQIDELGVELRSSA